MIGLFARAIVVSIAGLSQVHAADVAALLANDNGHRLIDEMEEVERFETVAALGNHLNTDQFKVGRMLCIIRPWTMGNSDDDDALSGRIWAAMAQETRADSPDFRWLDCAAANQKGQYRKASLDPMDDLREQMCAGANDERLWQPEIENIIRGIEAFDRRLIQGLAEPEGAALKSYYPLRNAMRIANLKASIAVASEETAPDAAHDILVDAVSGLQKALDGLSTPEEVAQTRNGWRMRADLEFHMAFYLFAAEIITSKGVDMTPPDLSVFAMPDAVLSNDLNALAISVDLKEKMGEKYVDPIFIERLLPGAQLASASRSDASSGNPDAEVRLGTKECGQWRRRSYAPPDLAEVLFNCSASKGLRDLDNCMSSFEAADWTLRFATVGSRESRKIADAKSKVADYVGRIEALIPSKANEDLAGKLRQLITMPRGEKLTVIQSSENFTTSEREMLQSIFARIDLHGIEPLFSRPTVY